MFTQEAGPARVANMNRRHGSVAAFIIRFFRPSVVLTSIGRTAFVVFGCAVGILVVAIFYRSPAFVFKGDFPRISTRVQPVFDALAHLNTVIFTAGQKQEEDCASHL